MHPATDAIIWVIIALLVLYGLYAPLAELICHLWHVGTLFRGQTTRRTVALTFDDGPDARYTPQILSILAAADVRATFFLVGQRADAQPQLVDAIVAAGHEVASHAWRHRHAWLRDPLSTYRDIARAKRSLEALTASPIRFYRPPWGAFTWAVRWSCTRLGLTPVLWSARAVDWKVGDYANEVVQRVVRSAQPGTIVLCHDAGGAAGAPLNTIRALPEVLTQLKRLGFTFETVGEMQAGLRAHRRDHTSPFTGYPLHRRLLIAVWSMVEFFFARMYRVLTLNAVFRISRASWHYGLRQDEAGQTLVQNGDAVVDLHFQNGTMISISNARDNRALVGAVRMTKAGLADVARALCHHPEYNDIRIVAATTLMNRGLALLGFHVEDVPDTPRKRRLERYMQFLLGMYHPDGFRRLRQGRQPLQMKLVWMTRDEIVAKYLKSDV